MTARILIDIGHGPYDEPRGDRPPFDPGARSPIGWTEFQVNMITALVVQEMLQQLGHFVQFVPFGLQLLARGRMAAGFDIFLSIHHNAFNGRTQGTEVCVRKGLAIGADEALAAEIAEKVSGALGIPNRGVLPLQLAVLSGARKTNVQAAVLTEGFFMDRDGIDLVAWARIEGEAIARAVHSCIATGVISPTVLS